MKSKLIILIAAAVVLASFTFISTKESNHPTTQVAKSGKNMVDKGQFD